LNSAKPPHPQPPVHALVADGPLASNARVDTYDVPVVDGRVVFEMPPVSAAVVVIP
jgi:hypothetical protein